MSGPAPPGARSTAPVVAPSPAPPRPPAPPAGAGEALTFASHGARVEVRVEVAGLIDEVRGLLPPGAVETDLSETDATYRLSRDGDPSDGGGYSVHKDGRSLTLGAALHKALLILSNSLHFGVAANSRTLLFVHAGAVAWGGRALLLPGPSHTGKSTIVDALVRLGATYFSDECAPLDDDGRVHPYRKPIWLRRDHPRHREPAFAAPRQPAAAGEALPVGLILFQRFRAGATWAPEALTPGQALLGVAASTVVAGGQPERTLRVLGRLVALAPAYWTERAEAEAVAVPMLRLLETQALERAVS